MAFPSVPPCRAPALRQGPPWIFLPASSVLILLLVVLEKGFSLGTQETQHQAAGAPGNIGQGHCAPLLLPREDLQVGFLYKTPEQPNILKYLLLHPVISQRVTLRMIDV